MCVLTSVARHVLAKRPYAPIGQLKVLLGGHVAEALQEIAQRKMGILKNARGLTRIEHVNDKNTEVFLQPLDVRVGAVHHFGESPIGEDLVEAVNVSAEFERIHEKVVRASRYLKETGEALKRAIRMVLQVDSYFLDAATVLFSQVIAQPYEVGKLVYVLEVGFFERRRSLSVDCVERNLA